MIQIIAYLQHGHGSKFGDMGDTDLFGGKKQEKLSAIVLTKQIIFAL